MSPKSHRPQCFFSYCHQGIDRESLDFLLHLLVENSSNGYDLHYDQQLLVGHDFDEFMSRLERVDSVILILTPAYKRRVLERTGGVYTEFTRIMQRYESVKAQRCAGRKVQEIAGYFDLIPILFSGDALSSIPDELRSIKYLDLVGLRPQRDRNGRFFASEHVRQHYIPQIAAINSTLQTIRSLKGDELEGLFANYFTRLFVDLKADWSNPRDESMQYIDSLFVKTHVFRRIEAREVYFLIGRKGSGKSTIAGVLATMWNKPSQSVVRIDAERFNLPLLYQLVWTNERVRSDMSHVFQVAKCLGFAWELFIVICCIEELVNGLTAAPIDTTMETLAPPLVAWVESLKGEIADDYTSDNSAHFTYALTRVIDFMEHCIARARVDGGHFYADIERRFSMKALLGFVIGQPVLKSFQQLVQHRRAEFLVTLDGFDTSFDLFRRQSLQVESSSDLPARAQFELDWLRSLMRLVIAAKIAHDKGTPWYGMIHFCITVPKDRFMELIETERDTYRYNERYCSLHWSGIELAILLRKRLEELGQHSTPKVDKSGARLSAEQRLNLVVEQRFPHLPKDIEFEFNGRLHSMPLFLYVLRHTFWRPRDVLWYYAKLLATAEVMRRKRQEMTVETIRRIVKDTTFEVIRSEFFNEFDTTIENIGSVVAAFSGATQILSCDEVRARLHGVRLFYASNLERDLPVLDKIELLYHVGFLGIVADERLVKRFELRSSHVFCFTEGVEPLLVLRQGDTCDLRFLIHPIFCEFLGLDTMKQELTLQLTWDYLHVQENLLMSSAGAFMKV